MVSARLGEDAELMDPVGAERRVSWDKGESVMYQRDFLIPCAPAMQVADNLLGKLASVLSIPGLQQVATSLL